MKPIIPILLTMTLLAGCKAQPVATTSEVTGIACAPGGATTFAPDCGLDRMTTARGTVLVLRHPDGGFRRLLASKDGLVAADGAEPAKVTKLDKGMIEVALGTNRYRLPATIGARP